MTEPGVRVEGARELRRQLKRAGDDLSDLKGAHAAAGSIVAQFAGTSAPRRSGRLASTVRSSGTATAAVVRAGKATVPYAPVIHWGWRRRGIPARPWISNAAQTTEPTWVRLYEQAVDRIVDRIKGASQ